MSDNNRTWITVEVGGMEVETTICEHHRPAIECHECDLLSGNYKIVDQTSWRQRLKHPVSWMKVRRGINKVNRGRRRG